MSAPQATARASRLGAGLAAFSLPSFRLLFANGLLSSAAMNVTMAVHSWLILSLSNDSALWVGVSVALNGTGQLVFSMVGGVLVDRFNRRNVLIAAELVGAVTAALLAAAVSMGTAWLPAALGVSFVFGAAVAVDRTAATVLVSDVAGPGRLLNAMALRRVAIVPMMVAGALMVGLLIRFAGIWAGYLFIAGALGLAPVFLLWLPAARDTAETRAATGLLTLAKEGVRYAARDSQVRSLLALSIVMEAFGFSYMTMMPVMAKTILKVDALGLGLLQAAAGVGVGVAVIAVAFLGNVRQKPRLIFLMALLAGVCLVAFSRSSLLPLSMVLAMLASGALMAYDIVLVTMLQLVSPPHMRGRVTSLYSLAIAFMALGGFATGAIGSVVGVPLMMTVGGSVIIGKLVWHRPQLLRLRELGQDGDDGRP